MRHIAFFASAAVLAFAASAPSAKAEEGMWTFDNFPIARANSTLGTSIDQGFLDRVRLASVKFGGCSAGVVSGEGLVLTNNHCVASCVANLSTQAVNYAETGFTPRSREEELKCPGGSAEILTDISDVTERMQHAGQGLDGNAFTQARDAEAGRIEAEACGNDPKVRCQVVSLYRGGQFKLYKFRKYSDVRLAWAPEDRAATFGGDLDNFSFPRFAIDAAFIRLYEDGKPAVTPDHFQWNASRPVENTPVFVSGNPGSTQRLLTQAQLATVRDVVLPMDQLISSELRGRLLNYAALGEREAFEAMDPIVGLENTYKRGRGRMAALIDPEFTGRLAAAEADFKARINDVPELNERVGDPWAALEAIQPVQRELYPAYNMLEARMGGGSSLYGWAVTLVRGAQERAKPSDQRLAEFADSRLPAVEARLFAERPTYAGIEQIRLDWWLSKTREWLTVDDARVRGLLDRESPEGLAQRLVAGTKLADPAVRRALWEGGLEAIRASDDPIIQHVLATEGAARQIRAEWEAKVEAPTSRASEVLAAARFAAYGDAVYPDATGTLRLTYGKIEGSDVPGQRWGAFTTFAGLWDRETGAEPFKVAPKLSAARDRIDPNAVLNMAVSTDTIGGSSGSPVLNEKGEIIGANFDSTVLSQRNAYGYDIRTNRSVIVTAQSVTEALKAVYQMDHLLEELGAK
ncbi:MULTISPECIES: S46 family peptidase [unclassified Brevundimonas]|uniref:S46 family peptidase n=1 Tax=unclassified Brevundimonas TaxID=2622653 RepID=UPI0025C16AD1|nr:MULTISPECIES: S46 family peptidase [unclassified Brevundimonas]